MLVCLMAGGHVLLEDVPGVGKTSLARQLTFFAKNPAEVPRTNGANCDRIFGSFCEAVA